MHALSLYGYHVRYGSSEKKEENYRIRQDVCFSPLFSSNCRAKYYRVFIVKDDVDLKKYRSNYCFFDKKQIENHLKQLPKFCDMSFTVTETKFENDDAYQIDFYLSSDNRLVHKYVLTWIRTLFEWPFYLYLVHAKELQKLPECRFESTINLFNVVASVHENSFSSNIHTFGTRLRMLRKSKILESVNKGGRVNTVFPRSDVVYPQCNLVSNFEDITPKLFEDNLPKYIEAYHLAKDDENRNNRK